MSTEPDAGRRSTRRALWLVAAVVAVAAALVAVAFATGLLHGATGTPSAARVERMAITASPPSAAPAVRAHQVRAMTRSVPTRVVIPSIAVDSRLMDLGLAADGTLETPPGAFPAGWFTGAPTPGEVGPAIIVGHVRYDTPGVFARLGELRRGARVDVERADGSTARFRVTHVEHVAKSSFPTQRVYGDLDHPGLRLITCGGLDATTSEFEENVVVFADLVSG